MFIFRLKADTSIFCAACSDDVVIVLRICLGVGEYKIAVNYFRLTNSFGICMNKMRINVISNDAHFDGKFVENKRSAEFKFETA